jgi:hypothetical protein
MYSKNYMKKIGSVALAGVMAASLSIPAFAANQTTVTATYTEPEIAVTVPDTGTIAINPYGLPVTFEKSDGTTVSVKKQQITMAPLTIRNDGDVSDLDAYVTVSSKVGTGSGVTFIASDPNQSSTEGDNTSKKIFLQIEGAASAETGEADDDMEDALIDEYATDSTWANATTAALDANGGLTTKTKIATLTAVDEDGYQAGSIALIRLTGKLVEEPSTAWSTKDGFTTTIAFTFKPAADDSSDEETVVPGGDDEETVVPGGDDEDDNT